MAAALGQRPAHKHHAGHREQAAQLADGVEQKRAGSGNGDGGVKLGAPHRAHAGGFQLAGHGVETLRLARGKQ